MINNHNNNNNNHYLNFQIHSKSKFYILFMIRYSNTLLVINISYIYFKLTVYTL